MIEASKTNFREMGRGGVSNIDTIIREAVKRNAPRVAEQHGVDMSEQRMQQSVNLSRMAAEKLGYDPSNLTDAQAGNVLREVDSIIHYGEDEPEYQKAVQKLMDKIDPDGSARASLARKRDSE